MRRKKIILLLVILFCYGAIITTTYGQAVQDTPVNTEEVLDKQMELLNWDSVQKVQQSLENTMPQLKAFDFKKEVIKVIKAEKKLSFEEVGKFIFKMLGQEVGIFISLGARFLLIVLLCSLLQTMNTSFHHQEVTKVVQMTCYLLIAYSVLQSLTMLVDISRVAIINMSDIMGACIPTLLAFMTSCGYVSSSAAFAPVITTAFYFLTNFLKNIILPSIIPIIILQMLSCMSETFKVDKMVTLYYRTVKWILRASLAISIGILGLYKVTLPYVDQNIKKAALNVSSALIPIAGDAVKGIIDFVIGCSYLIKNAFSVVAILWIILIVSMPLIKMLAYSVVYHVASIVIEPLGDKKLASLAAKVATGCEFIMSAVGIVALLCICVLCICISVGVSLL